MLSWILAFQKETYLAFGEQIRLLGEGGGLAPILAFLPMGLLLGAVHALMPGHSKLLLATYVASASGSMWRALLTAFTLAATHISVSVLIVLLSLPVIDYMFGGSGPGSSPILEQVSRGAIGVIGLWMIWRGLSGSAASHTHHEGAAFGFMAGLIPCPLTLFIMTYAAARGVTAAGLIFALLMLAGVALTLVATALLALLFRTVFIRLFEKNGALLTIVSHGLEVLAGTSMLALALITFV
jgi:ABC-type nickel/cobalt efflux system permease component RcnA